MTKKKYEPCPSCGGEVYLDDCQAVSDWIVCSKCCTMYIPEKYDELVTSVIVHGQTVSLNQYRVTYIRYETVELAIVKAHDITRVVEAVGVDCGVYVPIGNILKIELVQESLAMLPEAT